MLGTGAVNIAVTALLYAQTGSMRWATACVAVTAIAVAIAAPLGGWIVDHTDRVRALLAGCAAQVVAYVVLTQAHQPAWILVCAALAGVPTALVQPALIALVADVVPAGRRTIANARVAAGMTVGHLMSGVLGGAVAAAAGAGAVVWVAAAVMACATAALLPLRRSVRRAAVGVPLDPADHDERVPWGRALRIITYSAEFRSLVIGSVVLCAGFGFVVASELPLADSFGMGTFGFGLMSAAWGCGSLVGTFLSPWIERRVGAWTFLAIGSTALAAMCALIGTVPWFAGVLAAMVAGSTVHAAMVVLEQSLIQDVLPASLRGRGASIFVALITNGFLVGLLGAGLLIDAVGPNACYYVAAGLQLLGLPAYAWRARRLSWFPRRRSARGAAGAAAV